MDDFILCVKTKEEAKEKLVKIEKFLYEKLELRLNSKTQIFKSSQGVNFCGYKINRNRMKIRDEGKRNFKKKMKKVKELIFKRKIDCNEAHRLLAGHLGYISKANVWNLKKKLFYIAGK